MSSSGAIKEMFVVRRGGALLNTDCLLHWVHCFRTGNCVVCLACYRRGLNPSHSESDVM